MGTTGRKSKKKKADKAKEAKGLPGWIQNPFDGFLDDREEFMEILHVSMVAIERLQGMPQLVEAIISARQVLREVREAGEEEGNDDTPDDSFHRERAQHEAGVATREVKSGFPLLHKHAVIVLWTSLDVLIRSVVRAWLKNRKGAVETDEVRSVQIGLAEFEELNEEERYAYLVDSLAENVKGSRKRGTTRFESLLGVIGLGGPIDERVRRDIFELQQLRNVLLHRNGVADRRFARDCPWLGLRAGDDVLITHPRFVELNDAVGAYVLEIIQRVRVEFGLRRYEPKEEKPVKKKTSPRHRKATQKKKR